MAERPWYIDLAFAVATGLLLGLLWRWWGGGGLLVGIALRLTLSLRFGKVA